MPIPGYPFEGKKFWIDTATLQAGSSGQVMPQVTFTMESENDDMGETFEELEQGKKKYTAPRNATEEKIAGLWQEQMGIEKIGIHDDFFFLNGSSLVATQILARLQQDYRVEIPINRFFEEPSIAHLASLIRELEEKNNRVSKKRM